MKERLFAFLNNRVNKQMSEAYADLGITDLCGCGYANGYVAVPSSHPLYGADYNRANKLIDIHGGLTFSNALKDIFIGEWGTGIECIDFDNFNEIPKDYWIFGFDTLHFQDGPHLDREWCIKETNNLKEQLENIKRL